MIHSPEAIAAVITLLVYIVARELIHRRRKPHRSKGPRHVS